MKKKSLLVLFTAIATLSLSACSSTAESLADKSKQEMESTEFTSLETANKEMSEPEETNLFTETLNDQEDPDRNFTETSEPELETVLSTEENRLQTTDLFEQIYVPYANREGSFVFNGVKSFVSTLEYEIEITEPTEEDLGEIKIIDDNGDYIYFAFLPIHDIDTVMLVNYYHAETNSEVSMKNYSADGAPQYDKFTTHTIGENDVEVSGTDEQRNFLFKTE